jgi:preprotein translocase subunit YajC
MFMRQFLSFTLLVLPSIALAQAAPAAGTAPSEQPSFIMQAFPFIAMLFIFYFFLIRPQMRKQKEQQALVSNLKKGDEVLTSGGIFGTIEGLTEKFVTLEIADGVNIRILRTQIMGTVKEVQQ